MELKEKFEELYKNGVKVLDFYRKCLAEMENSEQMSDVTFDYLDFVSQKKNIDYIEMSYVYKGFIKNFEGFISPNHALANWVDNYEV